MTAQHMVVHGGVTVAGNGVRCAPETKKRVVARRSTAAHGMVVPEWCSETVFAQRVAARVVARLVAEVDVKCGQRWVARWKREDVERGLPCVLRWFQGKAFALHESSTSASSVGVFVRQGEEEIVRAVSVLSSSGMRESSRGFWFSKWERE